MKYYMLGIGGIGMSAIARYLNQRGDTVCGYDRTPSPLTQELCNEGIDVQYDDDPSKVPADVDFVIYTPAVPESTALFQYLQRLGVPMQKRSQVLGHITEGMQTIAVAGTHGKTSISSITAHLLSHDETGCSAFLGGIAKNFNSNILVNTNSPRVVVEADEFDRSFLQLHPYVSVVTATDADHLDTYGTHANLISAFGQFVSQTDPEGTIVVKQGLPHLTDRKVVTYTAQGIEADYYPWNLRQYNGDIYFDLRTPQGVLYDICLTNASLYNVENAVAASAVALTLGLDQFQLRHGLKTYAGVRRRFDYRIKTKELVMIDDYAHHPQEIAACLQSIRFLYPGKRVVGVFQPHLYTRTRDFADQFAEVLSTLDEVVLLPVYPAREMPIPGVNSSMLIHKINNPSKYLCTPAQVLDLLPALCPDVVVTMGAGDIDRLVPQIEERLKLDILS